MPSTSPQTLKLKSTLRLLIPRLRMAQKKDTAVSISSRREMSVLLSQSREASARIRVENIIQTDICVELMEILELYAELLLARAGLLDAREKEAKSGVGGGDGGTGLEEAAAAIIYAAPRLPREVRELGIVRGLLVERFGKEFAVKCGVDGGGGVVPKRVVDKLKVEPPGAELVEAYLKEIARTYGVEWPRYREGQETEEREIGALEAEVAAEESQQHTDTTDARDAQAGSGTGTRNQDKITAAVSTPIKSNRPTTGLGRPFSREELSRATPPRDLAPKGAKSPISVAPPAPRSDNPSPQVKMPGADEVKKNELEIRPSAEGMKAPVATTKAPVSGKIPDVDELAKRFSRLKR